MNFIYAMGIGFFLDILFGDPRLWFHPIRLIGGLIYELENRVRKKMEISQADQKKQIVRGVIFVFLVLAITGIMAEILHFLMNHTGYPLVGILADGILFFFCIAPGSLKQESMSVYHALKNDDLKKARERVSMIVGRDTKNLDKCGIIRAAVETVAENTSDGVTAPIFYMALGGPILCLLYKAVNTMDSMVGYRNEKYINFGKCAARLDDICNLIPARITAFFMLICTVVLKFNVKNSWKIYLRDRHNHKSPNSAQTESVCAGALGIRLAGPASYFGQVVRKPYIGDSLREVQIEDIKKANQLMYATAIFSLLTAMLTRFLFINLLK